MCRQLSAVFFVLQLAAYGAPMILRSEPAHLRSGPEREWASFAAEAHGSRLVVEFEAEGGNDVEYSLLLRQRDVKNPSWSVTLNGQNLGKLLEDERDMILMLGIPANTLRPGGNTLEVIGNPGRFSDDIEIRDIRLEPFPPAALLRQASVRARVRSEEGAVPVRVTVVDSEGSLFPVTSLRPKADEAIRTGVIYTLDGTAAFGLPAGRYTIYASRGFEYSAPSTVVSLERGQTVDVDLSIRHEVDLHGFVSVDTHVHTLELSGHGDANVDERLITAAGEGLAVIVATEHNRVADYAHSLRKLGLSGELRVVPGSEVTTPQGHFNVFPLAPGSDPPDWREQDWSRLMENVGRTGRSQVTIQNHPRDLHSNYRPFDPAHHLSSIGENLNGRPFRANAMEVINSGAMASDPLQLVRDWLGLLTRGEKVAAIGASDTHTVDFVPIGQARTYVDTSAAAGGPDASVPAIVGQLASGRNLVSYGLAADLKVHGPAIRKGGERFLPLKVTVWGPSWATADRVILYRNGAPVWERALAGGDTPGVKFSEVLYIPAAEHDSVFVAVATGPGVQEPFWSVRKPYQPATDQWNPMLLGVSRAVWVDLDENGRIESVLDYSRELVERPGMTAGALARSLAGYDASVTKHALRLMQAGGSDLASSSVRQAFTRASSHVRAAYFELLEELGRSDASVSGRAASGRQR